MSKRQRNKELSTDAHALRISGNIPHNEFPSPPAALYLSISTRGNSQVSTTSTKGGHCNGIKHHRKALKNRIYFKLYNISKQSYDTTTLSDYQTSRT